MDHMRALGLLDSNGKPLGDRIERVLAGLLPKLRRRFPNLQDEVAITEVMEEAGRRIASREARGGPIERLHGYAWVTVRSVATSHMRRPATRLIQHTLASEASQEHIALAPAQYGSPEQMERDILLREALDTLSHEERMICLWKKAGFSAQEIASALGRSVPSVDTLFSRAKLKIRQALGLTSVADGAPPRLKTVNGHAYEPSARRDVETETPDAKRTSGS
ncbi:MAG: sigma-70 family RNA polymerase sigma factor [Vicinamibacterales bacterium]